MQPWTLIHPTTLRRQGRRAWDMSALWLDPDARATALAQGEAFYRVLQRAHHLPAALRADLLLFDELDTRHAGEELLIEPLPPPAAVDLDALTSQRGTPMPTARAVPWILHLLDTLVRLGLHGLPSHLMLRPQCVYVTSSSERVIIAELGLSVLVPALPARLRPPGLLDYAAPELLGRHAAMRGDLAEVYAVGHIAARLLLPRSELPFLTVKEPRDKYLIAPPNFAAVHGLNARAVDTLARMCKVDPSERPSLLVAHVELRRIWSDNAGAPILVTTGTDDVERLAIQLVEALVWGDPGAVRAASAKLLACSAKWEPLARRTLHALQPAFGQLLDGAPALSSAALSELVASFDPVSAAQSSVGLWILACVGLIGIGLHHVADMDPIAAMAIFMQARALLARSPADHELLHGLLCAAEVEAALAAGRSRELLLALESLAHPVTSGALQALTIALRALLDLSLGRVVTTRAIRAEVERVAGDTVHRGVLSHALARLDLQIALTELPLGFSVGAARRWPEQTRRLLARLTVAELTSRILPQMERPVEILCQTLDGAGPTRKRGRGTASRTTMWRDCLVDGLGRERKNLQGLAVALYLHGLALLPVDASCAHHIELYVWLASAHLGVSREFVAVRYLAPAAAWLGRLPATPPNLSSPLRDAQRLSPAAVMGRSSPAPSSLFDGLDAEVTTSPWRVADWIMSQLLKEFEGLCATLTLLKLGNRPLNGRTVHPESTSASFEAALAACGWFNDIPDVERACISDRLREITEQEPLRAPLALADVTVPARPLADLEEVAQTRSALWTAAGLSDPAPESADNRLVDAKNLIEQANAALVGAVRRLCVIPSPLDSHLLHVALVDPTALKAASDAGLLYLHFAAEYPPSEALVEYVPSPELVDLEAHRRVKLTPAMGALKDARYDGQPLTLECDTLVCRAQINQGIFAELRFSAYLYRTYDEKDQRALADRLDELVSGFVRIPQWTDTSPPVPTQLGTLHLMAHEAKHPLLWMQRALTRLCDTEQISREAYREIEGLLDICVARLTLFCGTKVWDYAEFELVPRVQSLVDDWHIALRTSGEGLTLVCTIEAQADARPLWIRGQALELILSELLENARKHSQVNTEIRLRLTMSPRPTHCAVDITICNHVRQPPGDTARSQLFVERYSSTGLGTRMLPDLVRQLDDGRFSGQRDPHDSERHVTSLSFNAPFYISVSDHPNEPL